VLSVIQAFRELVARYILLLAREHAFQSIDTGRNFVVSDNQRKSRIGFIGQFESALQLTLEYNLNLRAFAAKLARQYATAYEKAKGPRTALVRQWMDAIEKR